MSTFSQLFEGNFALDSQVGKTIDARVVRIERDNVILDAQLKSEAVVPIEQFLNEEGEVEVAVDDFTQVVVEQIDGGVGLTVVSREKAKRVESFKKIESAHEEGAILKGTVLQKIRGGYQVDVGGVRAFLPGSLINARFGRDARDTFLPDGKVIEFKINSLDKEKNNVVISRRAVLEAESAVEREKLMERIYEGAVLKGIAKNMTDYGVFVDLGGIDGLLHNLDMSWRRVRHPSEVVNVGDEVEVKVLKFDKENNRVSLGMKQLKGDPWNDIESRYALNSRHKAKVTNITTYGFFACLEEGVEGLVHVSEISWTGRNVHPSRVVEPDQEVEVMILSISQESRRMSLSMKQCVANPWDLFGATHKPGDTIRGPVHSITDFGLFVGLEGGIDGLVHNSDVAWEPMDSAKVAELYRKDDEVEATVLLIDPEKERISLSIKHLVENTLEPFFENHPVGTSVVGVVEKVEPQFVSVRIEEKVVGQIRRAEFDEMGAKVGSEVAIKVVGIDSRHNVIQLSNRAPRMSENTETETERSMETMPEIEAQSTTLGDLLKQQESEEH